MSNSYEYFRLTTMVLAGIATVLAISGCGVGTGPAVNEDGVAGNANRACGAHYGVRQVVPFGGAGGKTRGRLLVVCTDGRAHVIGGR